jgi:hypothetical protein
MTSTKIAAAEENSTEKNNRHNWDEIHWVHVKKGKRNVIINRVSTNTVCPYDHNCKYWYLGVVADYIVTEIT